MWQPKRRGAAGPHDRHPALPVAREPAAAGGLPLRADLLAVRTRGSAAARCAPRWLAGAAPSGALPPVRRLRRRSRPLRRGVDRNLLIAMVLSMLVLVLWSSLQPPPPGRHPPAGEKVTAEGQEPTPPPRPARDVELPTASQLPAAEEVVQRYERPLYRAELTNAGAGLRHWELTGFHTGGRDPQPIVLTTGQPPFAVAGVTPFDEPGLGAGELVESLASRLGLGDLSRIAWKVESQDAGGASFVLSRNGVTGGKTWQLQEPYTVRLRLEVKNESDAEVATDFAVDWPAHVTQGNDFREQSLVTLHLGSVRQEMLASFGREGFWNFLTGPP